MKKVVNNIIPFKGFIAMCLWPFIFVREELEWAFSVQAERHENIHGEQQKEMLLVGCILTLLLLQLGCEWWSLLALPIFLWWYCIEWVIKMLYYNNANTAYRNISFEREAYANQDNIAYLEERELFAWFKYI